MEILNLICYACATVLSGCAFAVAVISFVMSVYGCFSKKFSGTLFSKIAVAVLLGCLCPWVLKLTVFFFLKIFV